MPQIEFNNVSKTFENDFTALDGVTFSIDKGEFVFLIGHSGAGKSTIIKMLIREESPDEGEILIDGQNIMDEKNIDLPKLRRAIGVVFQDFKVLDSKTVFENVAVALEVNDTPKHIIDEIVPNVLNLVGLQSKAEMFPPKLSGGEKQRLTIARAVAHEPNILVADEPTGMIDPESSEEVMQILNKINALGTTVLMATHDEAIVNKHKKRVLKIEKGKIVADLKKGGYVKES